MASQPGQRATDDAAASVEPPGLGPGGALTVVVMALVAASLVARRIDDPKWQVRLYAAVIVGLCFAAALRGAVMKVLLLLAVIGA